MTFALGLAFIALYAKLSLGWYTGLGFMIGGSLTFLYAMYYVRQWSKHANENILIKLVTLHAPWVYQPWRS